VANANSTIEIELEIKQALDQLNKLQDELKNSSKGFSQAGKSAQRFERVIKSAMSGVATAMKKSLSIITSFRTALVGLVGVYSASEFVQFGANFEREISKLNALTRATETEQLRLRKAIREVGSSTAFTATQAAAAANVLAALGRTSNQISQELGVVVRVAGATSTAIETVSEAIAAQINVFGESAEQVGNVFAAAYSTSAANVEKLQTALGQVGPVAKSAGLTLTETAGAIAFLIDRGFRAEAAGTALRGTLVRLINPSKAVLEEFQSLGVSFEEIQKLGFQDQMQVLADRLGSVASQAEKNRILTKIFGVEALAAANNLITAFQSGNRVIDNQAEKLRQATDAAGLYKQITSDLRGAIDELISAVQDKLLTAFQAAEPFVKEIVTQLKDAVNSLTTGQIIDAVENIGVILIKGAFGFYDLIRVAINAVYEFLNSPAFQQVIQIAKDSLASLGFTSLDDQIAVAEQEVLKQAVLIRELELSKESPFSIDFLTDQTIGAVQEQLDAAKAVLANLKAQKAEQESSLFLIKDRGDLEERLIGKIREGAKLIRERAQAQAQLGDVQESQTNQIASSATATVPVLNDISEQLENVRQAGEAAFGILTQQIKDIYSVAFDDDLPILDRVNQIDAFVKSIESSLPQLAGVLEPGQFQAVQTILVDLLNVSDALDKIGQSEAAEAFEKMGREIKKLDPKQQAEFARNLQAQFDQYEQIEEQVNQINERGIERTEVEQINYDYANEIAKVKADQNLTIEQEIKLVNALEDAQQRELDNQEKKLTALDRINDSLQTQLGLSEGAAAAVISGVSGAGPNASRAMFIAQSKSPEEAAAKLILSNEKVAKAIDSSFEILFDILDPLIEHLAGLIDVINDLIVALKSGIQDGLDNLGIGSDSYLFGGGFARDFEQFTYNLSLGNFGVNNSQRDFVATGDEVVGIQKNLIAGIFENIDEVFLDGFRAQSSDPSVRGLYDSNFDGLELTSEAIQDFMAEVDDVGFDKALNSVLTQLGDSFDEIANLYINGYDKDKVSRNSAAIQAELTELLTRTYFADLLVEPLKALDDITKSAQDQIDAIIFQNLSIQEQIEFRYQESIATIEQQKALADLIDDEDLRTQLLNAANKAEAKTIELKNKQLDQLEREQQLLALQNIESGLQALLRDFERTIEKIDELVQGLFDQVQELLFSDFSPLGPQEQFAQAQSTYESLLENAFDADATEEDIKLLQAFVNEYLTAARNVFKSSTAFTTIFEGVLGDLTGLGLQTSFNAPIQASSNLSSDLEEILSVLDEDFAEVVNSLITSIDTAALAFAQQQIEYITEVAQIPLTLSGDDIVIDISGISETVELTSDNFSLDSTNLDLSLGMSTSMFTVDTSGLNFGTITPTATAGTPNLGTITPTVSLNTSSVTNSFNSLSSAINSAIQSFNQSLAEAAIYARLGFDYEKGPYTFGSGTGYAIQTAYTSNTDTTEITRFGLTSIADQVAEFKRVFGNPVGNYAVSFNYQGGMGVIEFYENLSHAQTAYEAKQSPYLSHTNVQKYGFRQGGIVDPMDTIPAMLSPGEYILSPETVRRYGVSNLNRLNSGDTAALNATSDPEVKRLLAELIVAVRENDTEVNVYTDMAGQTKAGIEEFRSELRERTRRQGEQYVPARYI